MRNENSGKWTIGPSCYKVGKNYLCFAALYKRDFGRFIVATRTYKKSLTVQKKKISPAAKKAIYRFLNPNYNVKNHEPLKKVTLSNLKENIPISLTTAQSLMLEKILTNAIHNKTDFLDVKKEILLAFNFTKPKNEFNFEMFFNLNTKKKSMREIACDVGPMFFTKFATADLVYSFLEDENGKNFNELLAEYTLERRARLRTKEEGAIRDLAGFLSYGLLPNEKRSKKIKVISRDLKTIHDLCEEIYSNYKKCLKVIVL